MNAETMQVLDLMADRYAAESELNGLLKQFFQRKAEERSVWGELTKATHDLFGGGFPYIEEAASVTEMLLLALDVVDDLQDDDNPEMPWMLCGQPYALNAVLSLVFASVGELTRLNGEGRMSGLDGAIDLQVVSRMISTSVLGQQRDLSNAVHSEQDYISMIQEKSGSLLKLACYIGYAAAGLKDQAVIERMNELADTIGIISQIRNDVRDITRWDLKNDLLQKKKTLPVLYLLMDVDNSFPPFRDYYEGRLSKTEFLQHKQACMNYIEQSGCIEYSNIIQTLFKNRADELLEQLDVDSELKTRFRSLTIGN